MSENIPIIISPLQRAQAVGTVPFGPTGYRPPTCGGPGSGYVCCRAGGVPSTDFNEFSQENTIRDVRQQSNQVSTSKYTTNRTPN